MQNNNRESLKSFNMSLYIYIYTKYQLIEYLRMTLIFEHTSLKFTTICVYRHVPHCYKV